MTLFVPYIRPALALSAIALVLFLPDSAFAAEDLARVSERLEDNLLSIKRLVLSVIFFVGLVVFGMGIYLIYKDAKDPNRGHAKNGMIGMAVGALMLAAPTAVGVFGSTFFGSDGGDAQDHITVETGF